MFLRFSFADAAIYLPDQLMPRTNSRGDQHPMELLDGHFDGLLDEAGADELRAWVKQDHRHARMVADAATLHQTLREVLHGRRPLEEGNEAPGAH